jgi:hypothetical protein
MRKCDDVGKVPVDAENGLGVLLLPQGFSCLRFPDNDEARFIAAGQISALGTCGNGQDGCSVAHK